MAERFELPMTSADPGISLDGRRGTRDEQGRPVRLLDKRRAAKGIVRFGLPQGGWYMYWTDIFHTLLNMPRHRFLMVFFSVYLTEYLAFALLYLTQPASCVGGTMRFSHAMWFSVYTAATLGYTGSLSPNPDCSSVNVLVIFQVITAALIDYCMMGLVFARFASPNKRSFTIRFSSSAVLFQRPEDGLWCLSFRLANIRKHSLINPQVSLMLALPVAGQQGQPSGAGAASALGGKALGGERTTWAHFRFQDLLVEDLPSQVANLRLGLHAHINHIIRPGSPLYDASLDVLDSLGAEVLCFMEGVDPMTSNNIQARHSYTPTDIRMNERFVPIELKLRRGELGLDFSGFDATTAKALAAGGADDINDGGFATFLIPAPGGASGAAGAGPGGFASPAGIPTSALASAGSATSPGWSTAQPGGLNGRGQGGLGLDVEAGLAGGGRDPGAMMAAALSGDLKSHMQALRSQSIRSLTTPLPPPTMVPSVGGSTAFGAAAAASSGGGAGGRGGTPHAGPTHPLASAGGSGAFASFGSFGAFGARGGAGVGASPLEMRDLCDAVLTDVGASAAVKRQAGALKDALLALEHMPRGPAELAGHQL